MSAEIKVLRKKIIFLKLFNYGLIHFYKRNVDKETHNSLHNHNLRIFCSKSSCSAEKIQAADERRTRFRFSLDLGFLSKV